MSQHFIHFIRRQVRTRTGADPADPWFAGEHEAASGFQRPAYHHTRALAGAATAVKPGDTIWLIGQLYTPWGVLPPALDARIVVAERVVRPELGRGCIFTAGPASRWFPLAPMPQVLARLHTRQQSGAVVPLQAAAGKPLGYYLQRMRRLHSPEPLRHWERALDGQGYHFVSYRLADGTRAAFEKVRALVKDQVPVCWDRWSLPRRLAERREEVPDLALQPYLEHLLTRARVVWGIDSPLYGTSGSYSARERQLAQEQGTFCAVPWRFSK